MSYTKTYHIDALSCHDCANHVIEKLVNLSFVLEVHVDFDKSNITLTTTKEISDKDAYNIIDDILADNHCHEHNYGHFHHIIQEEFNLDVDCDHCARKVEEKLNDNQNIIDAKVSFENKKLIIKHLNNVEIYDIVSKTVSSVEHEDEDHDHHEHHDHDHECCDHHHDHHHIGCSCCEDEEEHEMNLFEKIILIIGV